MKRYMTGFDDEAYILVANTVLPAVHLPAQTAEL
jgi:hypothetical protein